MMEPIESGPGVTARPKFESLVEMMRHQAERQPDRAALIFLPDGETEGGRLTYAELDRHARIFAARIQAEDLAGQSVLLMLPSGIDYVVAFLGCVYAQAIPVPVFPATSSTHAQRVVQIIEDSGARAIVLANSSSVKNTQAKLARFFSDEQDCRLVAIDEMTALREGDWMKPDLKSGTLAYLQYTSGSTSQPRGVMVTHGNLLAYCESVRGALEPENEEVYVTWLPLFHDMGLIGCVIEPLFLGATIVLMPPMAFLQKPLRWLAAISRYRGTASFAPNFAYELCAATSDEAPGPALDLSCWTMAANAAEPVHADTLSRFAARFLPCGFRPEAMNPCYGLAEATLLVVRHARLNGAPVRGADQQAWKHGRFMPLDEAHALNHALVSCGPCLPGTDIVIVTPDSCSPCEEGEVGEIWIQGPTVAAGYWQRPEETAHTFQAHLANGKGPYLRTGDLGVMLQGELHITGRIKDLIIIRGQNHYPQDIEHTVCRAHPALEIGHGAAFSVEAGNEEKLVIVQEIRRSQRKKFDGAEVIQAIRSAIAERHGLAVYDILLLKPASVHITSSGKIQRKACRADYLERRFEPLYALHAQASAPKPDGSSGDMAARERYLAIAGWLAGKIANAKGLSMEQVGSDLAFNSLGLDSMDMVRLSGELSEQLKTTVEPAALYSYSNIGDLAQHLAGIDTRAKSQAPARVADSASEPLAILGMACRFPGASSVDAYWDLLQSGTDAITEVPASRWPVDQYYDAAGAAHGKMNTRWGGFVDGVDEFDAQFFGVSPREAQSMDPQQRLLLETAWHALEDAGIPPDTLAGSKTGVFVGISSNDYRQLQLDHHAGTDAYSGTGTSYSIAACRISYFLDLQGPSWAVDTACSSSLVALHQACASLRSGESDLAIVGGVNLILTPDTTLMFSQANMTSPNGRCKTFDAGADGYVRSEGCGVVILKRHADALRDQGRVLALVAGSAVNQDGRSNGLTAPNGLAQQAAARQALRSAGVEPGRISYIEAHGTGTNLGDPIEMSALKAVYGAPSDTDPTLWIGSVKTNIGHLEPAAGIAGLIKVVLALQHRRIPRHLHLQQLNPNISLDGSRCAIPAQPQDWPAGAQPRMAGISAFSFGGTNAHVIVQEVPDAQASSAAGALRNKDDADGAQLLVLSAKSTEALRRLARRYADFLERSDTGLQSVCHAAAVHRSHHAVRLALPLQSRRAAIEILKAYGRGEAAAEVIEGHAVQMPHAATAFLFTGQGARHAGMGCILYRTHEGFRQVLDRCDAILQPLLGRSLLAIFAAQADSELAQTSYAQPALFALEYALASVWQSCGMRPDYLIGHSLGEYVAACLAGVFSLEDGLTLVAHRGRLMQEQTREGAMLAVHAQAELIDRVLETFDPARPEHASIGVAAYNSAQDIVLSGDPAALEGIAGMLRAQGASLTSLQVKRAFHSPLMQAMTTEFKRCAEAITYHRPRLPVISNLSGQLAGDEIATPDYWVRHVLEPVHFAQGLRTLAAAGCKLFVEIGPHPVLTALGQHAIADGMWLQSLRRGHDDSRQLLGSLGQWYAMGGAVDWERWERARRAPDVGMPPSVSLPLYPFQPDRFWFRPGVQQPAARKAGTHPLLGLHLDIADGPGHRFQNVLSARQPGFIDQHRVFGLPVLPAAAMLEWALAGLSAATAKPAAGWVLRHVEFRRAMLFAENGDVSAQLAVDEQDGTYRVRCFGRGAAAEHGDWVEHARLEAQRSAPSGAAPLAVEQFKQGLTPQSAADCYAHCEKMGLGYGPDFRGLRDLWLGGKQALARIEAPASLHDAGSETYWMHPVVLDACLHALFAFLDKLTDDVVALPVAIARMAAYGRLPARLWCRITWHGEQAPGRHAADLALYNDQGVQLAAIEGMQLAVVSRSAFSWIVGGVTPDAYLEAWLPAADVPAQTRPRKQWLVYCDDAAYGIRLQQEFEQAGCQALAVAPRRADMQEQAPCIRVDPHSETAIEELIAALRRDNLQIQGLLFCAAGEPEAQAAPEPADHAYSLAQGGFLMLKHFLAAYGSSSPDIVVCTRGAQPIGEAGQTLDRLSENGLAQSVLNGMVKAVIAEYPHSKCVQLDLDPQSALPALGELLDGAARLSGAGHLACRGGQWYEAKLRVVAPAADEMCYEIRPDAAYLITGGLGGIGRSVAQWLVRQGARSLVLVGRRLDTEGMQAVRELEDCGAQVTVLQADIADAAAWRQVRAHCENCRPPVRGIVHAAGILDDGVIAQLDWPRFAKVLAPKVRGAWHLHQLAGQLQLDFFMLFSSVTALSGSAGQGNYIAANAFLDSLAHYRRQRGLPAVSINWGPWSEAGMAAQAEIAARLDAIGLRGMQTRTGLQAFASVLSAQPVQVGIAAIDWRRHAAALPRKVPYTLLSEMHAVDGDEIRQHESAAQKLADLRALTPQAARAAIDAYLLECVGRVLRLNSARQSALRATFRHRRLNELGLDSLMAIELRNRILADLSVDVAINYFIGGSTADEVAALINGQLTLRQLTATDNGSEQDDSDMEECIL